MSDEDIYRRGAAISLAIPYDEVSKGQRQNFKEAFFNCMWMYMYRAEPADRDQFIVNVHIFAEAVESGKSFEEAKQVVKDSLPPEKQ